MKRLLLAAGMATAVLSLTGVGAAGAADGADGGVHGAPGKRVGGVIRCDEVSSEPPNVFGRSCDSTTWGPLSDFVVMDRTTRAAYQCQTGWAEGSLWVNGQNCRPIPA
ncbi:MULTISPECIES: hypothetical protein [unclassified Kitasatospora]|uniref:hypothetical protein n=1 Tax=unclassified Kitasatospora TaxID=2633591 RepID=UPI00341813C7